MSFKANSYPSNCEKELQKICNSAKIRLKEENSLDIRSEEVAYTVTSVVLEEIATFLRANPDTVIEISSLLRFSTQKGESDSGEKGGNIVPVVEVGEKFKLGVKNDDDTEEDDE